jgi:anoctamin-10
MPILSGILQGIARRLTNYENYETQRSYKTALTQKFFVMDIITSYLAIFLTAFVYVPFGKIIVPYLDIFSHTVRPFAEHEKQMEISPRFEINPDRLRKQVIYFTVTAQVVNFCLELIVPYVQRRGMIKYKEIQSDYATKHGGAPPPVSENDAPEEAAFLARVRKEAQLTVYDVDGDIREMVIQFGYLSLYSVIWPLTAVSFLVNNWIELRADAIKICVEMQRPHPYRADTIGPWLDSLSFLTWMGSLTTSALVYMFSNDGIGPDGTPHTIKAWALLLTVFLSEQIFLVVRWAVRTVISKIDSPGLQQDRRQRFIVRQRYVEESFKSLPEIKSPIVGSDEVKIDKESLEEEARQGSLQASTVEDRFWLRQRGWRETAKVGAGIIQRAAPDESKKDQ